jgi:integrase
MKGSVYPFKGRWAGSVSLGKDEFGKRIRPTFYGDTKDEVEDKINTFIFEYKTGDYTKPNKDTLIGFLKEYHKICAGFDMWDKHAIRPKKAKWELTTSELYKMYIDVHFEPYFKVMKLVDVKPKVLDTFYNFKLSQETIKNKRVYKMSINTVRKLNTFLKSAFNYAIVNKQLRDNPTNHVILAKGEEYSASIYEENQFIDLLNEVSGTDDEVPIILGGGCGLRRGEIFGLYWRNVDLTNKTIAVEKTDVRFITYTEKNPKNETSRRTISVPDYVIAILRLYKVRSKNVKPDDKVITRWKPGAYSERFKKLLKKHGLPSTRLHDLRHYNATIMMKYNVPDKVSAKRLGHANTAMLKKVYQHVMKNMDENAASQINNTFLQNDSHQISKA